MASELRKKTQEAIDALHEQIAGCELVMLLDCEARLVLCKNSDAKTPQNELDRIASASLQELGSPLAGGMTGLAKDPALVSITRIEDSGCTVSLQDPAAQNDALICRFDAMPDRASLSALAADVFALTSEMEAA